MNWENIAIYLILIGIGVLIGSIKDVGKNTMGWVLRMIGIYFKQKLIEKGIITGDFDVTFGKFHPSTKQPNDSDWSIKVLHPHEKIEKCNVVFDKKKLLWDEKEPYLFIYKMGAANIPIPEKDFTENARVQLWDGKKILKNIKFEDLPLLKG